MFGVGRAEATGDGRGGGCGRWKLADEVVVVGAALEVVGNDAGVGVSLVTTEGVGGGIG